jgi:hypothetical protein
LLDRWQQHMREDRELADQFMAGLCLNKTYGLWVLLRYGLGRQDAHNQWVFDRCCEVQADPNGRLDLWSRGHYKSSVITFALTIQDILNNPEVTVGIFSHTGPLPKRSCARSSRSSNAMSA